MQITNNATHILGMCQSFLNNSHATYHKLPSYRTLRSVLSQGSPLSVINIFGKWYVWATAIADQGYGHKRR